jgi:hypothetical protein
MARRRSVRILLRVLIAFVVVYVVLSAGMFWAMTQPPAKFGQVMKHVPFPLMIVLPFEPMWMRARAGVLNAGDEAPDFRLPMLDRSTTVSLASNRGVRPVVLVFGSYT